jgi:hypothetical protein
MPLDLTFAEISHYRLPDFREKIFLSMFHRQAKCVWITLTKSFHSGCIRKIWRGVFEFNLPWFLGLFKLAHHALLFSIIPDN